MILKQLSKSCFTCLTIALNSAHSQTTRAEQLKNLPYFNSLLWVHKKRLWNCIFGSEVRSMSNWQEKDITNRLIQHGEVLLSLGYPSLVSMYEVTSQSKAANRGSWPLNNWCLVAPHKAATVAIYPLQWRKLKLSVQKRNLRRKLPGKGNILAVRTKRLLIEKR